MTSNASSFAGYIDVHHHVFPPFLNVITGRKRAPLSPIANDGQRKGRLWTAETSLREMDEEGTAVAITTIGTPAVVWDHPDAIALARRVNEYQAGLVRDYKGRFGMFATLPLNDMDATLKEVEYALDVLHADGVYTQTRLRDKLLGDPYFAPLWDELNRRKALLYTHPVVPDFCKGLNPEIPDTVIEITVDTTRAIASMLFTGVAARYQNVNIIWSHGGGTMPIIIDRFHEQEAKPYMAEKLPNGLLHEL